MSFEILERRFTGGKNNVLAGTARLDKSGGLRVSAIDLHKVQITDRAVLLIDRGTLRVALRTPADDSARSLRIARSVKRVGPSATIEIRSALRELGVAPPPHAVPLTIEHCDNILIVNLRDLPREGA